MGFTVEDMMVISKDRYKMKLIAGKNGWSNSISWLLMLEEMTITNNFSGKELAVTTGLGFPTTEKLLDLAAQLVRKHSSGLLINTGRYIMTVPPELIDFCDENDLPLLTVPWDVILADLIKDLSIRIFLQGDTDTQISEAMIEAIEDPEAREHYARHLLSHFDVDGTFQVILLQTKDQDLDKMDTVERRRLSYRMHLYLTNLTHNGHFFYYDSSFVLVINAVKDTVVRDIIDRFRHNLKRRMPEGKIIIGVSGQVTDISNLSTAYKRAQAALHMAHDSKKDICYFDEMGLYRLLYLVPDGQLLSSMGSGLLMPLIAYDQKHDANYVETLEIYLSSGGSIQACADAMYPHRNTILYRMNNIRRLLDCPLETQEERLKYAIACMILHMKSPGNISTPADYPEHRASAEAAPPM